MSCVLVTGANGFVGRHLCRVLVERGYHVKGLQRSSTEIAPDVEQVECGGLDERTDWPKFLDGVDFVVHLAARVHQMNDTAGEDAYVKANVGMTRALAKALKYSSVKRLIFLSSVKAFGERSPVLPGKKFLPVDESFHCLPLDPYGKSKLQAEEEIKKILTNETDFTILRPPLVYGEGVRANFLNLMKAAQKGLPLPLGLIDNRRSMIYVGNLVDAIATCITSEKASRETFFVTDQEPVSTRALFGELQKNFGRIRLMLPVPPFLMFCFAKILGKGELMRRLTESFYVSSNKIHKATGWRPPFSLQQSLANTASWYQTNS